MDHNFIFRCRDAIGCHRWSDEDFVGQLHLQRCRAACYPLDEKRRRGKYPPAQADSPTFSAEATSSEPILEDEAAVDDESSGENLGVIPLETDRTTTTSTTTEVPIPRDPRAGGECLLLDSLQNRAFVTKQNLS